MAPESILVHPCTKAGARSNAGSLERLAMAATGAAARAAIPRSRAVWHLNHAKRLLFAAAMDLAKPTLLVATGAALGALGTYAYLTRAAATKESAAAAAAAAASDEAPNTLLEEVRPSLALAKLLPKSAMSSTGSIAGHDLLDQLLLAGALRLASAAAETERAEATLSLSVQRSSTSRSEASSILEPSSPEMIAAPIVGQQIKSFEMPAAVPKETRWQKALRKALAHSVGDPWAQFELHKRPTELCVRWDYDAEANSWQRSETLVKMEDVSFAHGAMRECFRMKKMSQVNAHFFYNMNWEHCNNYVAKRYVRPVDDAVYFDDIKMQMVAKNLSTKFNARNPPKRVDFLHAFAIEVARGGEQLLFPNPNPNSDPNPNPNPNPGPDPGPNQVTRGGEKLLFCIERAMETGRYVKHNNNSGFVEYGDDGIKAALDVGGRAGAASSGSSTATETVGKLHRATPHAFSRFTFEATRGELMVVDIQVMIPLTLLGDAPQSTRAAHSGVPPPHGQGVDDLFTDPQVMIPPPSPRPARWYRPPPHSGVPPLCCRSTRSRATTLATATSARAGWHSSSRLPSASAALE